ncbi:hypothetical protein BJ508DRAFT_7022 [Ascobolus immersus RN42]|uniref:C2H2-type domain-containing protein n=1 Tax=Ascobolus immersus RN42 TaxID=1160509 RepID=A0A3N4IGQ2_ASCIM|nr:hypothetical protein BJ508DRAFT_7022 [Ascobolus immersus RN42]
MAGTIHYCSDCDRIFSTWQALKVHDSAMHFHICYICKGRTFRTHESFQAHNYAKHDDNECPSCLRQCATNEGLQKHFLAAHALACYSCDRVFASESALDAHNVDKHNVPCHLCDLAFASIEDWRVHDDLMHTFSCDLCEREFRSSKALEAHCYAKKHYTCYNCDVVFFSEEELSSHDASYHSFSCQFCSRVLRSAQALASHHSAKHVFRCGSCVRQFQSDQALESHRLACHSFRCSSCDKEFGTELALENHILDRHTFTCGICLYRFDSSSLLEAHDLEAHTLACEFCDRQFRSRPALNNHLLAEHAFRCDHCSGTFESQSLLDNHLRSHMHHCNLCPDVFWSTTALQQHKSSCHSFKCPSCKSGAFVFATEGLLSAHIIGSHGFKCSSCKLGFATQNELNKHCVFIHLLKKPTQRETGNISAQLLNKEVMEEDRYLCERCNERFPTRRQLNAHSLANHPSICAQCDRVFVSEASLQDHISKSPLHTQSVPSAFSFTGPFVTGLAYEVPNSSASESTESGTASAAPSIHYKQQRWTTVPSPTRGSVLRDLQAAVHTKEELEAAKASLPQNGVLARSQSQASSTSRQAVVIDCEMVGVGYNGQTLAYICAVDFLTGEVLVDSFVYPQNIDGVTDWRTRITGFRKSDMLEADSAGRTLAGAQGARNALLNFITSETIIIGHAVRNDLQQLQIAHSKVVDSQILLRAHTAGRNVGLKNACNGLLGKIIQEHGSGGAGHDCLEDVYASRELVLFFLDTNNKSALEKWGAKWRSERGALRRPPAVSYRSARSTKMLNISDLDDDDDYDWNAHITDLCGGYNPWIKEWMPGWRDSSYLY